MKFTKSIQSLWSCVVRNKTALLHFTFYILYFTFLTGCSKLNDLRVVGRNFEDEIQLAQNLVFTFNKDVVSKSDLDSWQSTKYIEFTPAVAGKFQWTAANELVFSPTSGFAPATDYKAKLSSTIKATGKSYGVSSEAYEFHTPKLQLLETEAYWSKSKESGKPLAKTKLKFNYMVNSSELDKKLTFEIDEKPLNYSIAQAQTDTEVPVSLITESSDKSAIPLKVTVSKGVKVAGTNYITSAPFELTTALPSMFELEIPNIETGFQNNQGFVRIVTTQTLQNENISSYYTITPAVETTTELTDNGLIVRGNFNQNETYILTLTDKMKGVLGAKLAESVTKDLYFGAMPANIQFANSKAVYLSAKGARNVGVKIVNIPEVQIKIGKVYENNILAYLRGNRYEEYGPVNGSDDWSPTGAFNYSEDEQNIYSKLVVDKVVETANLAQIKGVSALNLAIPDNDNFKGVFLVSVKSHDEQYLSATKLVSISDIGLIVKQSADAVWVFANSIRSTDPIANVEINLVSSNNQKVYTLKTDNNGIAKFEKLSEKAPNFQIAMVTASSESDFNYLYLEDTRVETSRFEVEGKRDNTTGFEAFIYGDRDIYRPGETLHFNTVVRTQQWKNASDIPLIIKVLMPNGRELQSFRKTTNSEGATEISLPIDAAAVTGTYSVEVYNGNDVLLASKNVSIEEFMPDRIKVDVKTDKTFYRTGQNINIAATALNLFGPPASGRNYEVEFSLKRKAFSNAKFKDYSFNIPNDTKFENTVRQGITDDLGTVKEAIPLANTLQDIGLLEGKIYMTVFDETGRPVNRLKRFDVLTQDVFYGIKMSDSYVGLNAAVPIGLVALNQTGDLQAGAKAQVDVVRFDYQTVVEKQGEQLSYTSKKREKVVYTNIVSFKDGKAEISYVPTVSGEYQVRVRRVGAVGYSVMDFYAYGWGNTTASSFEVSNEGEVLMEFDKPKYNIGDKATVLFKTPFSGKLLVTIERNNVLEYKYLTADNKSAEFSFKVTEALKPNAFVTATLIRALDNSSLPLTVAHGFAPIQVEDTDTKLAVEVLAVEKSRSKTKQKIRIKTARNAQVTIAVVDEGILQIKNFKTPDIHGFFYQKRALEVGSFDLYRFLFPELSVASSSSFGGDGYDLEKRINPLSNGRVKLVALWSGQLETGIDGEAEFEVDIPQFSGDLRIMAVAYKGNAFGSANKNMKVADPIVISTALPRFLSPDDEIIVPVNISNTEKTTANVKVNLQINGALVQDSRPTTQNLSIAPEKESRTSFAIKAAQIMGRGSVTVTVDNGKEKFVEKTEITVRPASSLLKSAQSGVIAGGSSGTIDLSKNGYIPSTVSGQIILSRSPMVQYAKALDYLLGYPHGCIEQTVSKAFPQIYFADLAKSLFRSVRTQTTGMPRPVSSQTETARGESDFNPNYNVQQAILKIESMQLPNGALSYWPGGNEESEWGTVYATHFLIEAQRAGFEINNGSLGRLLDYLNTKASTPATETEYVYNESGNYSTVSVASRTSLYELYVLAMAGKPNRAAMNYYKQNAATLTNDSRYLLAAAFKQIGDTRSYAALLPQNNAPLWVGGSLANTLSGSFSSPIRNLAMSLNTLIETDPTHLQIPNMAWQLSQALNTSSYLNTQEATFAFLALGKLAKKNSNSNVTAKLTINDKAYNFDGKDLKIHSPLITNHSSLITTAGKGNLYWFTQSEGLSSSGGYVEEDVNLKVRKQFLNRNGQPMTTFKQNDLVVVKISLVSQNGIEVPNVVVTDLLPAAFEIENPRLTEPRDMPWVKNVSSLDHFDLRDDRINYFTTATAQPKTFYYMVRVITKGTFTLGPVSADAMYSGDYRSYSGGGKVRVQ
jgi:alpha-2-macroglobulin